MEVDNYTRRYESSMKNRGSDYGGNTLYRHSQTVRNIKRQILPFLMKIFVLEGDETAFFIKLEKNTFFQNNAEQVRLL